MKHHQLDTRLRSADDQLVISWSSAGGYSHRVAALQPQCSHVFTGKGGYNVATLWLYGGYTHCQTSSLLQVLGEMLRGRPLFRFNTTCS